VFILYDILFVFAAIVYFPYLIIQGKWHSGFKMRFGFFPDAMIRKFTDQECIWIHAVSVGEVLAVTDLIEKLRTELPKHTVVCSTVTKTGNRIASEKLGDTCLVIYAPLDFSWVIRKFISIIKPKIYISMETEIWPNLYTMLYRRGIPIVQINGRISDKAFKGYKRIRFLTKRVLSCVHLFYMQSSQDAERIKQLGALPERIHIAGNLKFDNLSESVPMHKREIGIYGNEDIFVAGSTHPGEEEILVDAYKELEKEFTDLRLVLAPRHIERVEEIVRLVAEKGYKAVRFSQITEGCKVERGIIIIDSIGCLKALYGLAKIVFIGKTLTVGGGQNMIEPAFFGKPIIVGPLTQNFKSVMSVLLKAQAIVQIQNAEELLAEVRNLLSNSVRAEWMGAAAKQTVIKYQGATEKTVQAVKMLLKQTLLNNEAIFL